MLNGHRFVDQNVLRRLFVVVMNFHEEFADVRLGHFLQGQTNSLFVDRRRSTDAGRRNRIGRLRKSAVGQMFVAVGRLQTRRVVQLDFDAVHRFGQISQGAIQLIELRDDGR